MLRRLALFALLGALLAGCTKATPWPGHGPEGDLSTKPPVTVPNSGGPTKETPPGAPNPQTPPPTQPPTTPPTQPPLPADGSFPGDSAALEAALSAPSPLRYKIEIVSEPVDDPAKYLDDRLAQGGAPGENELLFILFAAKNYDIRFALGAMNPPLSPTELYNQIKTYYMVKSRKGDPAGGMADLVKALNHR